MNYPKCKDHDKNQDASWANTGRNFHSFVSCSVSSFCMQRYEGLSNFLYLQKQINSQQKTNIKSTVMIFCFVVQSVQNVYFANTQQSRLIGCNILKKIKIYDCRCIFFFQLHE
eukprot:GEMP01135482.1.p1 GENE.GEMP01135482.1~~GEMP01135482.1.p1  ORF type:complete len:113 (+),score=3.84 GEMP01135482.1:67-405(+)